MGQVIQSVWTCDGVCGTEVTTSGELPSGWVTITFSQVVQSPSSGILNQTYEKTFHALGPCLFDWGSAQMAELASEGANVGTGAVTPSPINTVSPVVTGTTTENSTLTTTTGTWLNSPSYTYRWESATNAEFTTGAATIAGANASTYILQAAQVGKWVRSVVIGTNAGGVESESSNIVGAIT